MDIQWRGQTIKLEFKMKRGKQTPRDASKPRKPKTEEQKKKKAEYDRQWREKNKGYIKAYAKNHRNT